MYYLNIFIATLFIFSLPGKNCIAQDSLLLDSASELKHYKYLKKKDFNLGEELTYIAHYGPINAGEAKVKLHPMVKVVDGKPCYYVKVEGKTIGFFRYTYKVDDTWETYFDTTSIIPYKFYRDLYESGYQLEEATFFNHKKGKVKVEKYKKKKDETKINEYTIPKFTQDIISGYYYFRTLDFENITVGDTISMNAFLSDEYYDFKIIYLGTDKVWTKFGKIKSFMLSPIMPKNSIFDGENSVKMWVSDDANRVPLKVQAEMFIGAIEVELVNHKGLKTKLGKRAD